MRQQHLKETEIKLTNVARASLGELLVDYQDYARVNKVAIWGRDHLLSKRLEQINLKEDIEYSDFEKAIESSDVEITVNTMIFLIEKSMFLQGRQLQYLQRDFIEQGGIRERMSSERKKYRGY